MDVRILYATHIGKETNLLEAHEEGTLLNDPLAVYSAEGEWEAIRRWLGEVSLRKLATRSGIKERTLRCYRQGTRKPPPEKLEAIVEALVLMLNEVRPA